MTKTAVLIGLVLSCGCARAGTAATAGTTPARTVQVVLPEGSWTMTVEPHGDTSTVVIAPTPTTPTATPPAAHAQAASPRAPAYGLTSAQVHVAPAASPSSTAPAPSSGVTSFATDTAPIQTPQSDWEHGAYIYP